MSRRPTPWASYQWSSARQILSSSSWTVAMPFSFRHLDPPYFLLRAARASTPRPRATTEMAAISLRILKSIACFDHRGLPHLHKPKPRLRKSAIIPSSPRMGRKSKSGPLGQVRNGQHPPPQVPQMSAPNFFLAHLHGSVRLRETDGIQDRADAASSPRRDSARSREHRRLKRSNESIRGARVDAVDGASHQLIPPCDSQTPDEHSRTTSAHRAHTQPGRRTRLRSARPGGLEQTATPLRIDSVGPGLRRG